MKIFMTNGSLMKVECIAECSRNTFDLHSAIIGLENPVLGILRVAGLHGFYCRHNKMHEEVPYYFVIEPRINTRQLRLNPLNINNMY